MIRVIAIFSLLTHIFSSAVDTIDSGKYIVLSVERLGLANRLRTLADWYQIAQYSNRILLVNWIPTLECNCSFIDLFEGASNDFKVLPMILPDGLEGVSKMEQIAKASNMTIRVIGDSESSFDFFLDPSIVFSKVDVIYTSHSGVVALRGSKCQHYMTGHSRFLRSLIPRSEIRETVKEILQHFSGRIPIGVHIRVHDVLYDWSVVPPGPNSLKASEFGEHVTVQDFISQMTRMSSALRWGGGGDTRESHSPNDTEGARGGGQEDGGGSADVDVDQYVFFVASNENKVKEQVRSVFPDSIVSVEVSPDASAGLYSRSSKDGIILALIEWLVLAECSLILHTYGSSFAMEVMENMLLSLAAFVHGRPLVGLWEGVAIYHQDERLPHCGHMQFLRHSEQGVDAVWEEGTFDKRKIKGRKFRLQNCPFLSDWNIANLYCGADDA